MESYRWNQSEFNFGRIESKGCQIVKIIKKRNESKRAPWGFCTGWQRKVSEWLSIKRFWLTNARIYCACDKRNQIRLSEMEDAIILNRGCIESCKGI